MLKRPLYSGESGVTHDFSLSPFAANRRFTDILAETAAKAGKIHGEGVPFAFRTFEEYMADHPDILPTLVAAMMDTHPSGVEEFFPRRNIKGEHWTGSVTKFEAQPAERSVRNTVPRVASYTVEEIHGHLNISAQAVYVDRRSVLSDDGEMVFFSLLLRLVMNYQLTLLVRLPHAILTAPDKYWTPQMIAARTGIVETSIAGALAARARTFGDLTKHGDPRMLLDRADAAMAQFGEGNLATGMFMSSTLRTFLSKRVRGTQVYAVSGPGAVANRGMALIDEVRIKGRGVKLMSPPLSGEGGRIMTAGAQFHHTVALGAFCPFHNPAKGLPAKDFTSDMTDIHVPTWADNGFSKFRLIDGLAACAWFVAEVDRCPWLGKANNTVIPGYLDFDGLFVLGNKIHGEAMRDGRTYTDYTKCPDDLDVFLRYDVRVHVKEKVAPPSIVSKFVPTYLVGLIHPRHLPNSHLLKMAECILDSIGKSELDKWIKANWDVLTSAGGGTDRTYDHSKLMVSLATSNPTDSAGKKLTDAMKTSGLLADAAGLMTERTAFAKTLSTDLQAIFESLVMCPVSLPFFRFLDAHHVPLPVSGFIFADSQTQVMEDLACLARNVGHHLINEDDLSKIAFYDAEHGVYALEGEFGDGVAILRREAIMVIPDVFGRETLGGNGNRYINELANGTLVTHLDPEEFERQIAPRVGDGAKQGNFSWYFVPGPITNPVNDATHLSSTGFFKRGDFEHDAAIPADKFPTKEKPADAPLYIGQARINEVYSIADNHRMLETRAARRPGGDPLAIITRRRRQMLNNILYRVNAKRHSSTAGEMINDDSHHPWGVQAENVRDFVSSEIPISSGISQDGIYYSPPLTVNFKY